MSESSFRPYNIWVDYLGLNKIVSPPTEHDDGSEDFITSSKSNTAPFARLPVPISADKCDIWGFPITTSDSMEFPFDTTVPAISRFENLVETVRRNSGSRKSSKKQRFCAFCKTNGEVDVVYLSHVLKDSCGRTTCPYLRKYTCPICGENGDKAHTIKYCPLNVEGISTAPLKTSRTSAGRKRAC